MATPDDFRISRGVREGYALALHIDPTGSYPNRVEGEPRLCGLYFKAVPSSETQQWFNSRWKNEALLVEVRRLLERVMEVKSEETFTLRDEKGGDVVGLEVVGPVRQNPSAVLMTSLFNTPRGQLQMNMPSAPAGMSEGRIPPLRSRQGGKVTGIHIAARAAAPYIPPWPTVC